MTAADGEGKERPNSHSPTRPFPLFLFVVFPRADGLVSAVPLLP